MSKLTYEDLQLPHFRNSRIVGSVGGTPITLLDAINAALLTKNNVFVAGKKGVGKTQLLFDMYNSRFGGKGVIVEGRPDLKADELFKSIDLTRLREGKNSEEVMQLAQAVKYRFFGADELNRCPEITQNELLSIMNGYIDYWNNVKNGYPIT